MKVKTFTGESLADALGRAKQEFGDDIILLESKEVRTSNNHTAPRMVQVSVSVDETAPKKVRSWAPPTVTRNNETKQSGPTSGQPGNDFNKVISNILSRKPIQINKEKQILDELAALRDQIDLLNQQALHEKDKASAMPASYEKIRRLMEDKGIKKELTDLIIKRCYQLMPNAANAHEKAVKHSVKKELLQYYKRFDLSSFEVANEKRVILLVGPTGVGKTTTAMKMAASQQILGKREVAIVSTDLYGPSEALKAFSKMNRTPVYERKQIDELSEFIAEFKNDEVIIVDTPGQSPFAPNYLNKLEEYVQQIKPTDIFLVLSMNTDLKDLFLAAALYLLINPSGLLLTKFDETAQPGKVFTILDELSLPLVAFAEGKRVFIDIKTPEPEYVFEKIFESA